MTTPGWKIISTAKTIYNFIYDEKIVSQWWGYRYGELKSKEKFSYQHKTRLPGMRDSLWYSDGTKLNYYYQYLDKSGKRQIGTLQVYEVMTLIQKCCSVSASATKRTSKRSMQHIRWPFRHPATSHIR
jgi:hypothetical protein